MTTRELGATLAGLRLLQRAIEANNLPAEIEVILTNEWEHEPLDSEGIDTLCEVLNIERKECR